MHILLDFVETVLSVSLISVCYALVWFWLQSGMLLQSYSKKELFHFLRNFIIIQILFNYLLILLFSLLPDLTYMFTVVSSNLIFVVQGIFACILFSKRETNIYKLVTSMAFSYFFVHNLFYVGEYALRAVSSHFIPNFEVLLYSENTPWVFVFSIVVHVFLLFQGYLLRLLLKRLRFNQFFDTLFQGSRAKSTLKMLGSILLMAITICFIIWSSLKSVVSNQLLIFGISAIALTVIFMVVAGVWKTKTVQIETQESIISQQKIYVSMLEDIQKETRFLRHDFQNLLSGLYLRAEDGDVSGIQNYLKGTLEHVDEKIGEELRQSSQLSNVKNLGQHRTKKPGGGKAGIVVK